MVLAVVKYTSFTRQPVYAKLSSARGGQFLNGSGDRIEEGQMCEPEAGDKLFACPP